MIWGGPPLFLETFISIQLSPPSVTSTSPWTQKTSAPPAWCHCYSPVWPKSDDSCSLPVGIHHEDMYQIDAGHNSDIYIYSNQYIMNSDYIHVLCKKIATVLSLRGKCEVSNFQRLQENASIQTVNPFLVVVAGFRWNTFSGSPKAGNKEISGDASSWSTFWFGKNWWFFKPRNWNITRGDGSKCFFSKTPELSASTFLKQR